MGDYFSRALQGPDDSVDQIDVQQRQPPPRDQDALRYGQPRPAAPRPTQPQQRPVAPAQGDPAAIPQEAAPVQPQAEPPTDYFGRAIGSAPPQEPPPSRPGSKLGTTRGDRVREAIVGAVDPQYGKLPNISSVLQNDGEMGWGNIGGEVGRWAVGASDTDMSKGYAKMLGNRYIGTETDKNGYPVIVYRGRDGQEARAYVNNPGLDMQDVARGAFGALPFAKSAQVVGAMGKAAPLGGRMFAQAAGQAGTSIAQDATAAGTGVSDFNPLHTAAKAGLAAAGGAGGEMIGEAASLISQRRAAGRIYDRTAGKLTPEGEAAATAAGIEPGDLTGKLAEDFANAFARTGNADAAIRQTTSNEFGIRRSAGEISGSKNALLKEQQYRGGTYGDAAETAMKNFDELQKADVSRAVRGINPPGSPNPSMAERIAPDRRYQLARGVGKTEVGENVAGNTRGTYNIAKEQESAAWKDVPRIKATPEALDELDKSVAARTADVMIDTDVTPMAAKMAQSLDKFKAGEAPVKAAEILQNSPANDVTTMRKRLLSMRQSAQTPEDKRASRAVYDAFLDWEVVAAEKSGDILAASKARTARETTRQLHEIFDGERGSQASNILKTVLKTADSPEQVVNAIFTGPASQIKGGAPTAIRQLKQAYDTYLEPAAAKTAFDDVRLAYWIKMTSDKGNEVKTPGHLASAIKTMLGDHRSLTRELYTPQEVASFRRLAVAMDEIKQKNPNTSWSGIAVGALMRDVGSAALKAIGWDSVAGRTVGGMLMKPVAGSYGKAQALRATGNLEGATAPRLPGPSWGGAGGAIGSQSQQ